VWYNETVVVECSYIDRSYRVGTGEGVKWPGRSANHLLVLMKCRVWVELYLYCPLCVVGM